MPIFVPPFQVADAVNVTEPPWRPWTVIVYGTPDTVIWTAAAGAADQLNVAFALSSKPLESIALAVTVVVPTWSMEPCAADTVTWSRVVPAGPGPRWDR